MTTDLAPTTPPKESGDQPDPPTPLLTLDEVAAILRIHERTIRRMVTARRLPCLRIGRQLRFSRFALDQWLRQREEGG